MPKATIRECRHCHRQRYIGGRGLCYSCYNDIGTRKMYPPKRSRRCPTEDDRGNSMTAAEVEAVVAEQMANKSDWWDEAGRQYRANSGENEDAGRRVAGALRIRIAGRRARL